MKIESMKKLYDIQNFLKKYFVNNKYIPECKC